MDPRRLLSLAAIFGGAFASLATSLETWDLSEEQSGSLQLDDDAPQASAHVTVKAQMEVDGDIESVWAVLEWTCTTATDTGIDGGKVRVDLVPDSGDPLTFAVTATRFEEKATASTSIVCSAMSCEEGFTLSFERSVEGTYDCAWKVAASTSEVGTEPPAGATLTVEID
ncbi:MAG: hypothetical protein HYY06_04195 [Deltaproteobacteria bacterium]|nr:hypothetical protein [Deltaproteobacteria bacterium]